MKKKLLIILLTMLMIAACAIGFAACNSGSSDTGGGHTHNFSDYVYNNDATCTQDGTETATCTLCSVTDTRTRVGSALGHDIVHYDAQEATCTDAGWEAYDACTRCDYTTYEEISPLGHDLIHHDGRDATCTESGWEDYVTCTRCDYTTYQPIPSAGHKAEVIPAVAATCTQNGLTEGQKCSVCGEILVEQEVIQAPGHTPVTLPAVAPTCTSTGLTEGQKCAVCDEIIVAQQVIAMTAHKYSDKWSSDADNHWHVCTVCGAEDDVSAHIPDRDIRTNGPRMPIIIGMFAQCAALRMMFPRTFRTESSRARTAL